MRSLTLLITATAAIAVLALPAAAQTTTTAPAQSTTTAVPSPVEEPAVVDQAAAPATEAPPWTVRYLVPTLLVLTALVVLITVVQYYVRVVRVRYKPVS